MLHWRKSIEAHLVATRLLCVAFEHTLKTNKFFKKSIFEKIRKLFWTSKYVPVRRHKCLRRECRQRTFGKRNWLSTLKNRWIIFSKIKFLYLHFGRKDYFIKEKKIKISPKNGFLIKIGLSLTSKNIVKIKVRFGPCQNTLGILHLSQTWAKHPA